MAEDICKQSEKNSLAILVRRVTMGDEDEPMSKKQAAPVKPEEMPSDD
jgi:hypothetical protein